MLEGQFTELKKVFCPYCGEPIRLVIEPSDESQSYTEDCEVCCKPIVVEIEPDGNTQVFREEDA